MSALFEVDLTPVFVVEKQADTLTTTMKTSALLASSLVCGASAFAPAPQGHARSTEMSAALPRETVLSEPDTTEFGSIWDPLGLAEMGSDETIAWFRHAEVGVIAKLPSSTAP